LKQKHRHSGARSSREPGIQTPDYTAGFRVCASVGYRRRKAHPGMTGMEHERKEVSMNDQQRRDAGMAQRRKVLGDAWVDKSIANQNSFNAEFVDLITRHAWADIWTRPHFDHRTRRILVIGTLVALGQWDEFRLHVRAALTEGGFSPDDIKEIILQQAIYCGVPAANHAIKEALAIVQELGLLKG
jgi:4-carboxymuconolactone decarboxylase